LAAGLRRPSTERLVAAATVPGYGRGMRLPVDKMRTLAIVGALGLSVGACTQRSEDRQERGAAQAPAVWEPIEKDFKGCEGG
jgi:hypothetical protein